MKISKKYSYSIRIFIVLRIFNKNYTYLNEETLSLGFSKYHILNKFAVSINPDKEKIRRLCLFLLYNFRFIGKQLKDLSYVQ